MESSEDDVFSKHNLDEYATQNEGASERRGKKFSLGSVSSISNCSSDNVNVCDDSSVFTRKMSTPNPIVNRRQRSRFVYLDRF